MGKTRLIAILLMALLAVALARFGIVHGDTAERCPAHHPAVRGQCGDAQCDRGRLPPLVCSLPGENLREGYAGGLPELSGGKDFIHRPDHCPGRGFSPAPLRRRKPAAVKGQQKRGCRTKDIYSINIQSMHPTTMPVFWKFRNSAWASLSTSKGSIAGPGLKL